MIVFHNVKKAFRREKGVETTIFDGINLTIEATDRIAVMGPKLCGKTTFIRMITGFEQPDSGEIRRYCDISYPVGTMSVLENSMTGLENIEHLSRVFGADPEWTTKFVIQHSELGGAIDLPVRSFDHEQKCRLSFVVSYALPFQMYALDAFVGRGSDKFREKCTAMLNARAKNSGIVLATANPDLALRHCQKVVIIDRCNIIVYDDINLGIRHFKDLKAGSGNSVSVGLSDTRLG